ncbi:DNA-binding transcriptional LysR family regulator [Lacrimispora xylanisolvens]|jgi:DNA-binding transcriptional LysR family regulator|uniref:DNA-binding transcriptional LysR family regulator n=1 Tax=Lacrimispora xylanisolvens TaxID=384636 RepID=A0A2S6HTL7_9FIRM|nr:selenium metabolism-associated LysR family transcriptional regulator [Hungatella xylanolytica]MBE5988965.1 LysR family transcriptional regulator [Paenibacillaceae bacterium]PPK81052.1 DNA-binding transcriptional LysR family regulator [Hungatella xylanolytica]
MEFKQLEAFVQISKLQSFSKASESLFLTQPALSSQINALEKDIGTQLFIRSTKKVYPTKAGIHFYEYAQKMLAIRDQSLYEMSKFSRECTGEVNILASSVPAQYILPQVIADFNKEYPNIVFHLYQKDSGEVFEELIKYQYDIGFVGMESENGRYTQTPLYKDQLVLILPLAMKYDGSRKAEEIIKFIAEKNFIMREGGSGTRSEMEAFFGKHGLSAKDLKTIAYFSNTQGIIEAVAQGMGISFVSKTAVQIYNHLNLINVVEIESELLSRNIFCVQKKDMILTPAQELFINFAKKHCQNI